MSLFKSLEQLWIKIQQKNIVLVSGNVDELIPLSFEETKKFINEEEKRASFISLIELLSRKSKQINNIKFFSNYSPNCGNNISGKEITINKNENNKNNDEFAGFDNGVNGTKISIDDYINWMSSEVKTINDDSKSSSCIFLIDFSDIIFNNKQSNIVPLKISQLIESFLSFREMQSSKFINNNYKLVIICRNPQVLNSLITNNVEFGSVNIAKPNRNERIDFFRNYGNRFDNLKDTINDQDSQDFKEAISISDGLSFREIFQLSKLSFENNYEKEYTFAELYKLATFFKKESEWEKLEMKNLDSALSKRVKGQEEAITKVKKTLIRSFVGMNGILHSVNNNKPKGVLFFAGPTGTGKTELAKSISEFVFGDENRIIRFDMSEFNHEHSDQRLIGAPPGYVGYDAGGELTNKVKENPFSILLFDEIEKAHGRILDKFLQILEDGRLTSSQGEIIDFSQTFIIFTSNIGTRYANPSLGYNDLQKHFLKAVKEHFIEELNRPEILNRIGEKNIVAFNFIKDPSIIKEIINTKTDKVKDNLFKEKNIQLIYNDKFIEDLTDIISSNFDKEYGGRGIITELETILIDKLSEFIFENYEEIKKYKEIKKGANEVIDIELSIKGNSVECKFLKK